VLYLGNATMVFMKKYTLVTSRESVGCTEHIGLHLEKMA
jgi:hypothetical protein